MSDSSNSADQVEASGIVFQVKQLVETSWFAKFVTTVIILNAITLGLETFDIWSAQARVFFRWFDVFVIAVFAIEIVLKLIAYRQHFFKSGWNVFDLAIVVIAALPGTGTFAVLRALRVVRVLRLLSVVPMMRRIVEALFQALPGMGAILAVLGLLVYVGAVMATSLYGKDAPELFGTLPDSALTLFQLMTLDGWRTEILAPVMEAGHPYAWVFFLVFIVLASFAVLNLFIALIVEALNDDVENALHETTNELVIEHQEAQAEREEVLRMLIEMKQEMAEMRETIAKSNSAAPTSKTRPKSSQ